MAESFKVLFVLSRKQTSFQLILLKVNFSLLYPKLKLIMCFCENYFYNFLQMPLNYKIIVTQPYQIFSN